MSPIIRLPSRHRWSPPRSCCPTTPRRCWPTRRASVWPPSAGRCAGCREWVTTSGSRTPSALWTPCATFSSASPPSYAPPASAGRGQSADLRVSWPSQDDPTVLYRGSRADHRAGRGGRDLRGKGTGSEAPVPNGFVVVGDLDALALGAAVDRLGAPMAVRSSGLLEDSATASFAGQLQTVLGVVGSAEAAAAILACGRSGTADRVRAYAVRTGAATPPRVPVVVQRLVAAEVAGVVFTQDPRTGLDDVVIEAAWGLGGSVVDGQVVPDRFTVSALGTVEGSVGSKATRLDWRDGSGGARRLGLSAGHRVRHLRRHPVAPAGPPDHHGVFTTRVACGPAGQHRPRQRRRVQSGPGERRRPCRARP